MTSSAIENLDPELKTYYLQVKDEVKKEHSSYIAKHPEIRQLLNDYLSTLLLEKPEDIYSYTQDYFSFFNSEKESVQHKPLVISGPSGVGKVASTLFGIIFIPIGNSCPTITEEFPRSI